MEGRSWWGGPPRVGQIELREGRAVGSTCCRTSCWSITNLLTQWRSALAPTRARRRHGYTPVTSRDSSQYRLKNPGNVPGRRRAPFWDSRPRSGRQCCEREREREREGGERERKRSRKCQGVFFATRPPNLNVRFSLRKNYRHLHTFSLSLSLFHIYIYIYICKIYNLFTFLL